MEYGLSSPPRLCYCFALNDIGRNVEISKMKSLFRKDSAEYTSFRSKRVLGKETPPAPSTPPPPVALKAAPVSLDPLSSLLLWVRWVSGEALPIDALTDAAPKGLSLIERGYWEVLVGNDEVASSQKTAVTQAIALLLELNIRNSLSPTK
jgi:hypothetical protein